MQTVSLWQQKIGEIIEKASPKLLGAYLFYTLALIFLLTQLELIGGDSPATVYLPVAVLKWGTLKFDPLIGQVPVLFDLANKPRYIVEVNGHYFSKFSPFPAMLSIPIYALYMLVGPPDNYLVYLTLSRLMSVIVSSTTAVIVFSLLRNILAQRKALLLALVYGLATFTWPMATNTFATQNTGEMFLALSVLMLVNATKQANGSKSIRNYIFAGLFASLAVASRPQTLPAIFILSVYVIHQNWKIWHRLVGFFLAAVPAALLLAAYNTWAFGLPWRTGYQNEAGYGWSYPFWKGIAGMLVSPSHGLLMYSPVMLLAFAGAWALWQKDSKTLNLWKPGRYLAVICLVQLLMMSSWYYWSGGNAYNQRMLHEVLPLIMLLVGYAWHVFEQNKIFSRILVAASAWGIWMNLVRAAFYDQHIQWSEVNRPDIIWSLKFSELAMYWQWHGPGNVLLGAAQVALMVGGLALALTVVMLRFAWVSNAAKNAR